MTLLNIYGDAFLPKWLTVLRRKQYSLKRSIVDV